VRLFARKSRSEAESSTRIRERLAPVLAGLRGLFSRRDAEAIKLRVGQPAPDFELPIAEGSGKETSRLSSYRGRFVFAFFLPTEWCPVCQIHLRVFQRESRRLADHRVKLMVVSHRRSSGAAAFAQGIGTEHELLLDDSGNVSRSFGAARTFKAGKEVSIPMAFLIDPAGTVRCAYELDDISVADRHDWIDVLDAWQ
jgi:peroxiredoxin Q/BCP